MVVLFIASSPILVSKVVWVIFPYYQSLVISVTLLFMLLLGLIDVNRSMKKQKTLLLFSKDFMWSKFHPDYKSKISYVKK
jgi:hypothetical protein